MPPDQRKALELLRKVIKSAAPGAEEVISYQMPCYKLNGTLVYFGAFKDHMSLFPGGSITKKYEIELKRFITKKGTIQFTIEKPLPADLVKKIVKDRVKENEQKLKLKKRLISAIVNVTYRPSEA